MDPATGSFVVLTDDKNYIGKSFTTEIKCTSLISEDSTTDSFEIFFQEESDTAGTNPCLNDEIYFQSSITNFAYTVSYPANQLFVNVDYN
jgi:hypothetical protein